MHVGDSMISRFDQGGGCLVRSRNVESETDDFGDYVSFRDQWKVFHSSPTLHAEKCRATSRKSDYTQCGLSFLEVMVISSAQRGFS